jgi:hypothetical protein
MIHIFLYSAASHASKAYNALNYSANFAACFPVYAYQTLVHWVMPLSIVYFQKFIFDWLFLIFNILFFAGKLLTLEFLLINFFSQQIFKFIWAFGISLYILRIFLTVPLKCISFQFLTIIILIFLMLSFGIRRLWNMARQCIIWIIIISRNHVLALIISHCKCSRWYTIILILSHVLIQIAFLYCLLI